MFYSLGLRRRVISCAAGIAALILAVSLTGCGSEKSTSDRNRYSGSRGHASTRTVTSDTPSTVETASAAVEPEKVTPVVAEEPREVTYEEAEAAYNEKRYTEAVKLFVLYTERKSENPWGYYMLGLSSRKAGDLARAEDAFQTALELDPNHVKSWINLGRVLLDAGRPAEALEKIDAALALDPEVKSADRLKGRAYHQLGQIEDAVDAYRKAIMVDRNDAWAMNNLALIMIEQERFDEALKPLARAIELKGDVAIFRNNLGMALERTGRFRAAEKEYAAAVEADESNEKAYSNLSRVEGVEKDVSAIPFDLAGAALEFTAEIDVWEAAMKGGEKADSAFVGMEGVVVGILEIHDSKLPAAADTTGTGKE